MTNFPTALTLVIACVATLWSPVTSANGTITNQVNHLSDHLNQYQEEVEWLNIKFAGVVDGYGAKGNEGVKVNTAQLIEFWEQVDFHSAIETQHVPTYASIWQGIYGIKSSIDAGDPVDQVRAHQKQLNQALWQGLGAVKLAAQYQQRGWAPKVQTTEVEPSSPDEIVEDIINRLDRVVAKHAEQLNQVAVSLVHETYEKRFESIESALKQQDHDLAEALEKDFVVTLPQLLKGKGSVDQVRAVINGMKKQLMGAKALLNGKKPLKNS